jgi:hypothetical protein
LRQGLVRENVELFPRTSRKNKKIPDSLGQRVGYLRVEKEEFIAACRGDVFIPIC